MSKPNILVIGGGVIGLSSAYYLRKHGATVTVLEMNDIGNGCSMHNAGYVCPSHFVPLTAPGVFSQGLKWMFNPASPLYIKPRLDFDFLAWSVKFARSCNERVAQRAMPILRDLLLESQQLYEQLFRDEALDCDYQKRGLTVLFNSEKGKASAEHEADVSNKLGIQANLMGQNELRERDSAIEFAARGGVHFPGDAMLVPATFVKNLATLLEKQGVVINRNCRVESFERERGRITRVRTNKGTFEADEFVLASGAWSQLLARDLGLRMMLQAGKGYSITYKRPPLIPKLPYIFSERRAAITPFANAIRFAGTMEIAGISTTINRRRVEAILDAIPFYIKNIPRPQSALGEVWGGMRPVTPDGMPYIGRFKQIPNLIAATGHAMIGMCLAPITGKIISELVSSGSSDRDLVLLDPNRFDA
jgi:D-amino-acid dehydrogenase